MKKRPELLVIIMHFYATKIDKFSFSPAIPVYFPGSNHPRSPLIYFYNKR